MSAPVRDTAAMIAGMDPALQPGAVVFCATQDRAIVAAALPDARALVTEPEGVTLVLPVDRAEALGFAVVLPMRQITLRVHSALDGVGLTAAVSGALAAAGIPCNVIAGAHHDHLFVPAAQADMAVSVLKTCAVSACIAQSKSI